MISDGQTGEVIGTINRSSPATLNDRVICSPDGIELGSLREEHGDRRAWVEFLVPLLLPFAWPSFGARSYLLEADGRTVAHIVRLSSNVKVEYLDAPETSLDPRLYLAISVIVAFTAILA